MAVAMQAGELSNRVGSWFSAKHFEFLPLTLGFVQSRREADSQEYLRLMNE
jgi:hypothetical protein